MLNFLYGVRETAGFYLEPNLWIFWIIAVVLSALFFWGIVYIAAKNNYVEMKKEQYLDTLGKDHISRRRQLKGWKQIQNRLKSAESNQWKLAILEADRILNEILKMSGYLGIDLDEKFEILTAAQLACLDEVKNAHVVAKKIMNDPSYDVSLEMALEIAGIYGKAFKELNLIEE